jgi:hypothetical protein
VRGERLEAQGIRTPAALYRGMSSYGIPTRVASALYSHEKAHADADEEGKGEFGFVVSSGWIIAYYMVRGERTPEQMMKIASAPGFLAMSGQDWKIYRRALAAWKAEQGSKKLNEKFGEWKNSLDGVKSMLLEKLVEKISVYEDNGEFPDVETLLSLDYNELVEKYGGLLKTVYRQAVNEVMNDKNFSLYLTKEG